MAARPPLGHDGKERGPVNASSRLFHAIVLMGCALAPVGGCGGAGDDPCAASDDADGGVASHPECQPSPHVHPDGGEPDGGWPPTK
jgi:hypothetical protein